MTSQAPFSGSSSFVLDASPNDPEVAGFYAATINDELVDEIFPGYDSCTGKRRHQLAHTLKGRKSQTLLQPLHLQDPASF